jgi:hypothetical protein
MALLTRAISTSTDEELLCLLPGSREPVTLFLQVNRDETEHTQG